MRLTLVPYLQFIANTGVCFHGVMRKVVPSSFFFAQKNRQNSFYRFVKI